MKIINKIKISGFRSIRLDRVENIGDFTTLVGLNNSGKSNYLRALNLFFNGEVEPGLGFVFDNDYYRPDVKKKRKKKSIEITVYFNIPDNFKFRKGLDEVKKILIPQGEKEFAITKEWIRGYNYPNIYINENFNKPLETDDRSIIEQFLSLISFRYIPNRVLPVEIIKKEHQALKDVLMRRVSRQKQSNSDEVLKKISETAERIMTPLYLDLRKTIPDVEHLRLSTPESLSDVILTFGYRLKEGGTEFEDTMQGSGIQSVLMYETLYLIDKDYFQKFGWRQASIWAIEEPESSLHSSLIARMGDFLSQIVSGQNSRMQVISTTHSEMIIQYSDKCYLIKKTKEGSKSETDDISNILESVSKMGITGWQHPILRNPLVPLLIVDGDYDVVFFREVTKVDPYGALSRCRICCLKEISLAESGETGGTEALVRYIRNNIKVIKNRSNKYPVVIILDWEKADKKNEIMKHFEKNDPIRVLVWDESRANPKLGREFSGMERFLSDRIIDEIIQKKPGIVYSNSLGKYTVRKKDEDYQCFKKMAVDVIKKGLKEEDLNFAKHILEEILKIIKEIE